MMTDRHCSGWRRSFFVNAMYSWIWRLVLVMSTRCRRMVARCRWMILVTPISFVFDSPDPDDAFLFGDAGDKLLFGMVFDVAADGGVDAFEHAEAVARRGREREGGSNFKVGDGVGGSAGEIGDGGFRWRDITLKLDLITGDTEFGCGSSGCLRRGCGGFFWIHDDCFVDESGGTRSVSRHLDDPVVMLVFLSGS